PPACSGLPWLAPSAGTTAAPVTARAAADRPASQARYATRLRSRGRRRGGPPGEPLTGRPAIGRPPGAVQSVRFGTRSAGEWLERMTEVPRVLRDPGARVLAPAAGTAAIVPLDCPDGHEVHVVRLGEVEHRLCVGEVRHFGLLRVVVYPRHHREPFHSPDLRRGQVREDGLELGVGI